LGLFTTSHFHFLVLRLEVSHIKILVPIKRGRGGGDLRGSVVNLVDVNGKNSFCFPVMLL
jgi:hypothetical protein